MDKKTAICQYLKKHHTGGERAVYSRELQRLFSIDGRGLRRKINSLRQEPTVKRKSTVRYAGSIRW